MWFKIRWCFALFINLSEISWLLFLVYFSTWPLGSTCLVPEKTKQKTIYWDWIYALNWGDEVFVMPSYSIHEHEIRNVFPFVQVYFYVFQKCFPPIDLAFFLSFLSILSFWCYWKWRLDFYHIFNYSLFYLLCTHRKYWVLFANSISCHFTQFLLFRCSVVIDSLGFSTYTITSSACRNSFPSSFPESYASNYSLDWMW